MKKLLLAGLCVLSLIGCSKNVPSEDNGSKKEDIEEVMVERDEETGIRYFSFGTGKKTMVIVPGLATSYITDSADLVVDSFTAFKDDYTVYLFDVREEVTEDFTIEDMGEDLVAMFKKLGLKDVHLYGCSMGGMESIYVAGEHPDLVEKVTVVSSACAPNETMKEVVGNWVSYAKDGKCTQLTTDMGEKIYSEAVFETNREVFESMGEGLDETILTRFVNEANAILKMDLSDTAAKITCPLLVIGAEGDHVLSADASKKIAEITGGELYMYPEECSHAVYDEVAEVKEKAKAFFDRKD